MSRFAPYLRTARFIAATVAAAIMVLILATRHGRGQTITLRLDKDPAHIAKHALRGKGLQPGAAYTVMLATSVNLNAWRDIAVVGGAADAALLTGLAFSNVNQYYKVRDSSNEDPDGDGRSNKTELREGTDPLKADNRRHEPPYTGAGASSPQLECARRAIIRHHRYANGTAPSFENSPGSPEDLADLASAINGLSEQFYCPVALGGGYAYERTFAPIVFGSVGADEGAIVGAAGKLIAIVPGFCLITNSVSCSEREGMTCGQATSEGAWNAALTNAMTSFTNYPASGPTSGVLRAVWSSLGKWGAYFWSMANTVNFKSSSNTFWMSGAGASQDIVRVMVGSVGDFAPSANRLFTAPDNVTNHPGDDCASTFFPAVEWQSFYRLVERFEIELYVGDSDGDGIPDFADGFDFDGAAGNDDDISAGNIFDTWAVVLPPFKDLAKVKIRFTYSGSPPEGVVVTDTGGSKTYAPAEGNFRLWSRPGWEARNGASVPAGHYVAPGTEYSAADLGFADYLTPITFYLEAVRKVSPESPIKIECCEDEVNWLEIDRAWSLTITVDNVDLRIDSNNDGYIGDDDDVIENDSDKPGKIIFANCYDSSTNDVPDFADGFDMHGNKGINRSCDFAVLKLRVPPGKYVAKVPFRLSYSAADPALVKKIADKPPVYQPGSSGKIRIWKKNGHCARCAAPVNLPEGAGDYLSPGDYIGGQLFPGCTNMVRFFVEGVNRSDPDSVSIKIEMDEDNNGEYESFDEVRCIVASLQLACHDVTGFAGVGGTPGTAVPRVPLTTQAKGAACDGLDGVAGGARLLLRLIGSPISAQLLSKCEFDFGLTDTSVVSGALPRNGSLSTLATDEINALEAMGVVGVAIGSSDAAGGRVLTAKLYTPPLEFDLADPLNPKKSRPVGISIQAGAPVSLSGFARNISLVRPPLVMVHGINSSYINAFIDTGWVKAFNDDYGFACFGADHSATDDGNGHVNKSYEYVRDAVSAAVNTFHVANIAAQKCDIAAHSYGGVLSRWYVEKSLEYKNRHNVRKIITMGTPHRGAPICNIMCETYLNKLFYNAESDGATAGYSLGGILDALNKGKIYSVLFGGIKIKIRWYDGAPPLAGVASNIVPAVRVLSVGSPDINELNASPFQDDVAYGSVVGTDEDIGGLVNAYVMLGPCYESGGGITVKSYFPWLKCLDGGDGKSDAIVPYWSQILPACHKELWRHHQEYMNSANVRNQVRKWLNSSSLPRGAAHKTAVDKYHIPYKSSRDNAYRADGVYPDAIVQTRFSYDDGTPLPEITGVPVLNANGRKVKVICTGMVDIGGHKIDIVTDEVIDKSLHAGIPVPYTGDGLKLCTFCVTGTVARGLTTIVGPNGKSKCGDYPKDYTWEVGYEMKGLSYYGWSAMQSPPSKITLPKYCVPPPDGPNVITGLMAQAYVCRGYVNALAPPGGKQKLEINLGCFNSLGLEKVLSEAGMYLIVPPGTWDGSMIPYEVNLYLHRNAEGHVAGSKRTSGATSVPVFQSVHCPPPELKSVKLTVTTAGP